MTANGVLHSKAATNIPQLGGAFAANQWTTVPAPAGSQWIQFDASNFHAVALAASGKVSAWGANNLKQVAYAIQASFPTPVALPNVKDIKQVACGGNFSLALQTTGWVQGWGDNSKGQLGIGNTNQQTQVTVVNFGNNGTNRVKEIAAGNESAFFLMHNGTGKACGFNLGGALGIGNSTNQSSPTSMVGTFASGHLFRLFNGATTVRGGLISSY